MTATTHTFNWHDEPEHSFLKNAMLHFVVNSRERGDDREMFNELEHRTDKFAHVELGITINGVEMDAKAFMDRLDQGVDWAVERRTKEALTEKVPGFDELTETVAELEAVIKGRAIQIAADAGFELTDEDGRWRYR